MIGEAWRRVPFDVKLAVLVLFLSIPYAVTFSHLIYVSLLEQAASHAAVAPRYAGTVHQHNAVEWVLLVGPSAIGWLGLIGSLRHLARRLARRLPSSGSDGR